MTFTNRQYGRRTIVEIPMKDLDSSIATLFKNHLLELLESSPDDMVVIDLENVRFLDSTCLGALLTAFRQTGSKRKVALAAPQTAVLEVLNAARITRVMAITRTLNEALCLLPEHWLADS